MWNDSRTPRRRPAGRAKGNKTLKTLFLFFFKKIKNKSKIRAQAPLWKVWSRRDLLFATREEATSVWKVCQGLKLLVCCCLQSSFFFFVSVRMNFNSVIFYQFHVISAAHVSLISVSSSRFASNWIFFPLLLLSVLLSWLVFFFFFLISSSPYLPF